MIRHQLKPSVRRERRALSFSGMCRQHDNARLHTARHNVKQVPDLKLELSHPPCSLDLAPTDFYLLAPKDVLRDVTSGRMGGVACRAGTAVNTCCPKELLP